MANRIIFILLGVFGSLYFTSAQSLEFEAKTTPNLAFIFDTFAKYQAGITQANFIELNIVADGVEWDLYVGAQTDTPDEWNTIESYALTGETPETSLVELQFRNAGNTSQISGFFSLTDIATPTYIIGTSGIDGVTTCNNVGANEPGSYLNTPECHQFRVDMRIKPDNYEYQPGLYTLQINFVLVQTL